MKSRKTITDNDLRLARIFCKIVECGGVAAAEADLGVGRSTISRQLQDFETRLGLVLCERGRGGFRLTQAGVQVLGYVETLLASVDDFATEIASLSLHLEGRLRIGLIDCSFTDPANPIDRIFKQFQSAAPNVRLDISVGSAKELERRVLDGKLHFAVVPEYWFNDELNYIGLYQEKVGLFAGRDHEVAKAILAGQPLSKTEIQEHSLVFRSFPEPTALQRRKAGFAQGASILYTEAVYSLVASGCHLGFLPVHLASEPEGKLLEILPEEFGYEMAVCLVSRQDRQHSVILQRFLNAVRTVCFPAGVVAS